jgi:hypothetical protein
VQVDKTTARWPCEALTDPVHLRVTCLYFGVFDIIQLNEITLGFDGEKPYQKMCFFDNMDLNINFNDIANDMRIQLSRGEYYIGNKRKNQCNNCVQYFKQ